VPLINVVTTGDGRHLSVEVTGDLDGRPVFLLHGTPGSRLGPRPRSQLLHRLGVRLISFDRPGYGGSDRLPGRRVADAAADVALIADTYGHEHFAVVGRSGGGPHALACAALLPERVSRALVLVGLAPRYADGLDWSGGMADSNMDAYASTEDWLERELIARLTTAADNVRVDPSSLIAGLQGEMTDYDRRVVADAGIRMLLMQAHAEALRESAHGWIDDVRAFRAEWGFDPATVSIPVLLWHGEADMFSPVSHSRWLGARIRDSTVVVKPDAAHFDALPAFPDLLQWLIADLPSR
jgi:pimeloyl-ACP methyl ester carboxylesterase